MSQNRWQFCDAPTTSRIRMPIRYGRYQPPVAVDRDGAAGATGIAGLTSVAAPCRKDTTAAVPNCLRAMALGDPKR